MKWQVMDTRNLEFEDETFDIIIDKATIDSLLHDSYKTFAETLKECSRVLKTGGCYVAISYGHPTVRELHFQRKFLKFEITTHFVEKDTVKNFVYVCRKLEGADEAAKLYWNESLEQIKVEEAELAK